MSISFEYRTGFASFLRESTYVHSTPGVATAADITALQVSGYGFVFVKMCTWSFNVFEIGLHKRLKLHRESNCSFLKQQDNIQVQANSESVQCRAFQT